MKYDDASWHYGGDYPDELPPEGGATHIAMFVAWMLLNGFAGELPNELPNELNQLQTRESTPGEWFIRNCDEKFTDEDLTDEGNEFAQSYYCTADNEMLDYLTDYADVFSSEISLYHVADSWANYDRLAPVILNRMLAWRRSKKPLWTRFTS